VSERRRETCNFDPQTVVAEEARRGGAVKARSTKTEEEIVEILRVISFAAKRLVARERV